MGDRASTELPSGGSSALLPEGAAALLAECGLSGLMVGCDAWQKAHGAEQVFLRRVLFPSATMVLRDIAREFPKLEQLLGTDTRGGAPCP